MTQRNPTPSAACIVVNWNGGADLVACLDSLFAQSAPPSEVVLADNGSTDGSAEAATARFPSLRRLDLPHNPGFGGAVNAAAPTTSADLLAVLNPDVVLAPDWLATVTAAFAADPQLGVAGAKLLFPDGRVQHAGGRVLRPLMLADHRYYGLADTADERDPIDVDYVTGAAIAIRRAAFDAVGGFDERFFLYFEETDLCARVREAGWRVRYLPLARAVHRESAVTGRESAAYYRNYHRGRIRYALKHVRAADVLSELVPAERSRIDAVVSLDELAGLRHAFVDHAALLGGPEAADLAADQPELRPALAYALAGLAEHVVATVPSELRAPPGGSGRLSALKDLAGAARRLAELERRVAALERRAEVPSAWLVEIDRDLTALARRVAADR